ncbi:MAG: hypothetical protein RIS45_702 [Planctomycetota bacterium]
MLPILLATAMFAQVQVKDPRAAAAEKQAAFVAQSAATALNHDIALLQRLEIPFPKPQKFSDVPAGDVMKEIRAAAKSPIEFDSRATGESGGWEAVRVTCEPATVRQALDAVLRAISPEYEPYVVDVAAGVIVITDGKGQRTLKVSAPYPLDATFVRMGARDGDETAFEAARSELTDFFMVTRNSVWEDSGGEIGRITWTGSVATVEATPGMHHDIRMRLAQLEQTLPSSTIEWTFTVASVAASADSASVDAAIGAREAFEKLAKDGGATVLCAPKLLATANEPAEIEVGSDSEKTAMQVAIKVEPTPARTGRVFVLRAKLARGGATGEFAMRAAPGVRLAALVSVGGEKFLIEGLGLTEAMRKIRK